MVARVATFEGVNAQETERRMDEAAAIIRPLVEGLAGFAGFTQLMSAEGRTLSITFFDSDENADAAESTFEEEMPRRLGEMFQGFESRRVSVDRYKVLVDERR